MNILKYKQINRFVKYIVFFVILILVDIIFPQYRDFMNCLIFFTLLFYGCAFVIQFAMRPGDMNAFVGIILSYIKGNKKFPYVYWNQKNFNAQMNDLDYDNEKFKIFAVAMSRYGINENAKDSYIPASEYKNCVVSINGKWKLIKVKTSGDNYICCIVVSKAFFNFMKQYNIKYMTSPVFSGSEKLFTYVDGINLTEDKIKNNINATVQKSYEASDVNIVFKIPNNNEIISKFKMLI